MDSDEESRDDDRVDSDDQCDNPDEKMEFKLFYEMWKVGKWAVTVTNVQKDLNELLFIVHLEESNQPEDLNWEVVTTQSDINDLYNYCEDTSHLPSISTIMEYSATETEWNEEEARESLEKFLQGLVTDPKLGSSELVFTFLCPAHRMSEEEQNDGIWDLLAKMASFLTSGLEEDDEFNEHSLEEKQNDETTHQHELDETQSTNVNTLEGPHKEAMGDMLDKNCWYSSTPECLTACTSEKEESAHSYDFDHPETSSSGTEGADDNVEHHTGHPTRHAACLSSDSDDDSLNKSTSSSSDKCYSDGIKNKRDNLSQKKSPRADKPSKEQKHDYKVIFDLLKEISGRL
ncbi:uncharacterized protein si:rp71-46j2.7 [Trichomycterus rosablanca]|uniref:uncharacterized protein si:rp71-46j2.7 n=1 Tax=Trichomycterus rosablanca TaxID=2290929 RepID=UPI002F35F16C